MLQFRDILLNNNNGKPNSRIIKHSSCVYVETS